MTSENNNYNTKFPQKSPNQQTGKHQVTLLLESRNPISNPNPVPKTKLKKRLSPLRYPGGKSKVIDQIYACLDEHCFARFVEPFAGGASLGLSLLDAGKIGILEMNELDPSVYNFWNVVLNCSDELMDCISGPLPTIQNYMSAKIRLRESQKRGIECDIQAAFDYLLLNRTSFGGIILANPVGGKNGTDEQLRQRWNPLTLIKRISKIAKIKDRIMLTNRDAVEFLRNKRKQYGSDTTIFVDPPYTKAGKQLYLETFTGRHQELAETIAELYCAENGPKIVITYDECELIRTLYPQAAIKHLRTSWSIYRAG